MFIFQNPNCYQRGVLVRMPKTKTVGSTDLTSRPAAGNDAHPATTNNLRPSSTRIAHQKSPYGDNAQTAVREGNDATKPRWGFTMFRDRQSQRSHVKQARQRPRQHEAIWGNTHDPICNFRPYQLPLSQEKKRWDFALFNLWWGGITLDETNA